MKALIYKDINFTLHYLHRDNKTHIDCKTCHKKFDTYLGYYYTIPFSTLINPTKGEKMCADCAKELSKDVNQFMFKYEHGLL